MFNRTTIRRIVLLLVAAAVLLTVVFLSKHNPLVVRLPGGVESPVGAPYSGAVHVGQDNALPAATGGSTSGTLTLPDGRHTTVEVTLIPADSNAVVPLGPAQRAAASLTKRPATLDELRNAVITTVRAAYAGRVAVVLIGDVTPAS